MILFQISKFVLATMHMRYCDAVLFLTAIYMSSRRPWDWTAKHFHSTFDVSSISYWIYFPFLIILFYNVLNIRLLFCKVSTLFKIWILVGTSQLLRRKKIWRTENLQTLKRLSNVPDKQLFFVYFQLRPNFKQSKEALPKYDLSRYRCDQEFRTCKCLGHHQVILGLGQRLSLFTCFWRLESFHHEPD